MRSIPLILGGTLAAVALVAAAPGPTAKGQREFQLATAGKVALPPASCMPYNRNRDMVVLDDNTVLFKNGTQRVYVAHLSDGCHNIVGPGPYALVTKQTTGTLCHGDIAEVEDTMAHVNAGSCIFDSFTPYEKPRG